MTDRKITLVEYHSHGNAPQFFPDLLRGAEPTDPEEDVESEDDASRNGLAVIVSILVLLGIGVALKYFYGEEEEPAPPSEQVEVTEYEE